MKEKALHVLERVWHHVEAATLALVAVFAPIHSVLAVTLTLVVVDLVTGVIAAKKEGAAITSSKLKRSVGKLLLYELALCVSFLVQQYLTGELFPASKIAAALIGVTELKSVMENISRISGGNNVFSTLLDRAIQAQKAITEKKDEK
jgi:phage-related holin